MSIEYTDPTFRLSDTAFRSERITAIATQNEVATLNQLADLQNIIIEKENENKETGVVTTYPAGIDDNYLTEYINNHIPIENNALLGRPYTLQSDNTWRESYNAKGDLFQHIKALLINQVGAKYGNPHLSNKIMNQIKKFTSEYINYLPVKHDPTSPLVSVQEPNKIAFQNGVYNFDDNTIKPITPDDYITSKLPYNLIPSDPNDETVKYIRSYIEWLVGDSTPLMVAYMGFLFYRSQETIQTLLIMINGKTANGRNGKGKMIELMQAMLGDAHNYSAVEFNTLADPNNRFIKKELQHKLANFDSDADASFFKNTATLKSLSSNDMISSDVKGKDPIQFRTYARLILATNELPSFRDDSDGIRQRWLLVPFIRQVTTPENAKMWNTPDSLYSTKNKNEKMYAPDALGKWAYYCIQEFKNLTANNLNANPFANLMTDEAQDILTGMSYDNDPITQFINDKDYLITSNEDDYVIQQTLWDEFNEYAENNKQNKRNFLSALSKKGCTTKKNLGGRLRAPLKMIEGTRYQVVLGIKALSADELEEI